MYWIYVLIAFLFFGWVIGTKNEKEFSDFANECAALNFIDKDYRAFVDYGCNGWVNPN